MRNIIPLPNLPKLSDISPTKIVQIFDKIRFDLDKIDDYAEFCWFAREYPRCYRYYLNCAKFRLKGIYQKYQAAHIYFSRKLQKIDKNCFGMSYSDQQSYEIYWDYEAFLSAVNTSLDLLARIVGTTYYEQMPLSFNKLCKKKNLNSTAVILKKAQKIWVSRMKDYRDCFVHYTPVDTLLSISVEQYSNGWEVRGKLPTNPNVRDIIGFKFSRRVELLKYAISVFKHTSVLDSTVSKEIYKLYKANQFPKQLNNLFFQGKRDKSDGVSCSIKGKPPAAH